MAKTILIVDDSKSIRQMLNMTLTEAGFKVVEGENGQDGLTAASKHKIDLVITDLNMPLLDGIGMIKALRGKAESKFTPIIMLTTESAAEMKQAGKSAGATGWIVKPFEPEKLLQVVGKLLN